MLGGTKRIASKHQSAYGKHRRSDKKVRFIAKRHLFGLLPHKLPNNTVRGMGGRCGQNMWNSLAEETSEKF
jgi:hypothetical protein